MESTIKPSILFLTTSSNWPLTDGKRQRTWFLIEALSQKYYVDVLLIGFLSDKTQIEESNSSYRKLFFVEVKDSILFQPNYPNFMLSKKQRTQRNEFRIQIGKKIFELDIEKQYEFVFSRYLRPLFVFPIPSNMKLVCDADDIYFEAQQTRIKNESNLIIRIKLSLLFLLSLAKVKRIMKRINVPVIVKSSDRKYFNQKRIPCIPNLPFGFYLEKNKKLQNNALIQSEKVRFGFIGKLSYRPNYQGIIEFVNTVWNPLMSKGFDGQFVIAGSGEIPKELKELIQSSKNIELLGFVENSRQFWNQISILVVPVAEGGGSNIKIAEAFMYNKKVVGHPFAARGYEAFLNENCLFLPQSDKQWIHILRTIYNEAVVSHIEINEKAQEVFDLEKWNQSLITAVANND